MGRLLDNDWKRSRTTSQSGERSSMITVTTVDRSRGSDSIAQVNASVWLMNSVIVFPRYGRGVGRVTSVTTTGDFLPYVGWHKRWLAQSTVCGS